MGDLGGIYGAYFALFWSVRQNKVQNKAQNKLDRTGLRHNPGFWFCQTLGTKERLIRKSKQL
jgi:hypothetical protein